MPKISIIVPVYNSERSVSNCIKSILAQSFKDFELILVDDGSKDSSFSICKKWNKLDKRVFVYSKDNGGPGSARRYGVSKAQGDYINFVDADDTIPQKSIEELYNKMVSYQLDIVQGNRRFIPVNESKDILSSFPKEGIFTGKDFIRFLFEAKCNAGPVGSLYKKNLFNALTFNISDDIKTCEDLYMNICLGINAKKIGLFNDIIVYNYIENKNSLTHTYKLSSIIPYMDLLNSIEIILSKYNLLEDEQTYFYAYGVNLLASKCFHNHSFLHSNDVKRFATKSLPYILTFKNRFICLALKYKLLFPIFVLANRTRRAIMRNSY